MRKATVPRGQPCATAAAACEHPVAANTEEATPAPLKEVLGFQLRRAHVLFALHWQLSFADRAVAITPVQGGVLLVLDRNPGLSQVALARLMDVEGPTLVQVLDRLEEAGLVERIRRSDDRRSYALYVTAAGRAMLAAVADYVPHREAELLVDLSPAERAMLLELLQRVVRRGHVVTERLAQEAASANKGQAAKASRPKAQR